MATTTNNNSGSATPSSAKTSSSALQPVKSDDALSRRGSQGPGELCPGCQKKVYFAEKLLVKGTTERVVLVWFWFGSVWLVGFYLNLLSNRLFGLVRFGSVWFGLVGLF
jgi:hypothetical protein